MTNLGFIKLTSELAHYLLEASLDKMVDTNMLKSDLWKGRTDSQWLRVCA